MADRQDDKINGFIFQEMGNIDYYPGTFGRTHQGDIFRGHTCSQQFFRLAGDFAGICQAIGIL